MVDATSVTPDYLYPDRRGFEDLVIGDTFPIPSRTMTEALFAAFQTASADNHPIHYDREYCRRRNHPDLLAHGFPDSRLRLDRIGALFGDPGFGPLAQAAAGGLEGALFGGCIAGAMVALAPLFARRT